MLFSTLQEREQGAQERRGLEAGLAGKPMDFGHEDAYKFWRSGELLRRACAREAVVIYGNAERCPCCGTIYEAERFGGCSCSGQIRELTWLYAVAYGPCDVYDEPVHMDHENLRQIAATGIPVFTHHREDITHRVILQ